MSCGSSPFLIQYFIELVAVAQARQSIGARQHCWLSLRAYFALELHFKIAGQTDECQCERSHDRGNEQCSVPPNHINIRMRLCHHDDERQVRQSLEEIQASCTVDIRRIRKAALWRLHELLECAGATDITTYDFSVPAIHVCLATVQKIVSGSIRAVYQSARCQRKSRSHEKSCD